MEIHKLLMFCFHLIKLVLDLVFLLRDFYDFLPPFLSFDINFSLKWQIAFGFIKIFIIFGFHTNSNKLQLICDHLISVQFENPLILHSPGVYFFVNLNPVHKPAYCAYVFLLYFSVVPQGRILFILYAQKHAVDSLNDWLKHLIFTTQIFTPRLLFTLQSRVHRWDLDRTRITLLLNGINCFIEIG